MRCPKCGYISFDHLEKCLKCKKDIEAVSDGLAGSTYNIEAPSFLKLKSEKVEDIADDVDMSEELAFDDDEEYVDEDLEILMEEDDAGPEPEVVLEEDEQEEDQEIEIDFSQFEDADESEIDLFDGDEDGEETEPSLSIEMPEELSDLSDLAPPDKDLEKEPAAPAQLAEVPEVPEEADGDFTDLNLDDLDFDLGLDEEPEKSAVVSSEEAGLALDEIDFAETLSGKSSPRRAKSEEMDLDLDLDFDLDLGSLSMDKDD